MFCTILGFIEVDAYKIFRIGMPPKDVPSHLVFTDALTKALMRNSYEGCPDSSIPRRGGQDSTDTSVDDDSHEAEAPLDDHQLILVDDHARSFIQQSTQGGNAQRSKRVRCRICRSGNGKGLYTTFCCSLCSKNDPIKRPFGICGPASRRNCLQEHQDHHG